MDDDEAQAAAFLDAMTLIEWSIHIEEGDVLPALPINPTGELLLTLAKITAMLILADHSADPFGALNEIRQAGIAVIQNALGDDQT